MNKLNIEKKDVASDFFRKDFFVKILDKFATLNQRPCTLNARLKAF